MHLRGILLFILEFILPVTFQWSFILRVRYFTMNFKNCVLLCLCFKSNTCICIYKSCRRILSATHYSNSLSNIRFLILGNAPNQERFSTPSCFTSHSNVLMMEAGVYIDVISVISLDKYDFEQKDQHPLLSVPRNRTQSKPFQTKIWFEIWMKAVRFEQERI